MDETSILRSFFFNRMSRTPNLPAVYDYCANQRYTYGQLHQRALKLSHFLKLRGLQKGDRVAILSRNDMVYIDLYYAYPYTGVITTSYNARIGSDELNYLIQNESPKILFYSMEFVALLASLRQQWPNCEYIRLEPGENPYGSLTYPQILSEFTDEPLDVLPIGMEDTIQLLHTGGTTGIPKAAMIPIRQVYYNAVGQQNAWNLRSCDRTVAYLPMFHTGTWNTVVTPMLYAGGLVVLVKHFHTEDLFEIIPNERITILWGVPTIFRRMMEHELFSVADFSSIIRCRCGAAPPELDLLQRYWEKGVCFCNGYGMTETSPGNLSMPADAMAIEDIRNKRTSCGKLMAYNEAKIIDESGNTVPVGQPGELLFRGNLLFSGYWNNKKETSAVLKDGWFYTGDIASVDADGFYYLLGRKKNVYITCGENIYPNEIMRTLLENPSISESYVFGVPDKCKGEVGKALVVLRQGCSLSEQQLRKFLEQRLATIQQPTYLCFVSDIPKNAIGKVDTQIIFKKYGLVN